jgi:RHH-type transcriptional regulator, rel operon repressor / antitoxin RelB
MDLREQISLLSVPSPDEDSIDPKFACSARSALLAKLLCYTCIAEESAMLALRLPPEIEKRLDNLAKMTGRTKSYYARQAILEYIDDLEDLYLAERRVLESGPTIPLEEVMRKYADIDKV